jgi:Flp pilus assembly protein TadD/glycosyltransferase involved in cell wall biosynthesis
MQACISQISKQRPTIQNIEDRRQFTKSSSNQPLISAIVSIYNSERFMRGCLEDLEAQTIADKLEIIIIDSASPQNEEAIVREFQQRFGNIKYIRTPERETVYQAWNQGIKLASGTYITNANTDDRHRNDAFENMVRVLDENEKVVLVYADVIKTDQENQTFRSCTPTGVLRWYPWDRATLLEKGCFMGPQPMWRRSVHDDFGFFDEQYTVSADYEFWLRISQIHDFKHIDIPLGLYLNRPDSIEHADQAAKRTQDTKINRRYRTALSNNNILAYAPFEELAQAVQTKDARQAKKALQQIHQACQRLDNPNCSRLCDRIEVVERSFQKGSANHELVTTFIREATMALLHRSTRGKENIQNKNTSPRCLEEHYNDDGALHFAISPQGGVTMQLIGQIHRAMQDLLQTGYTEAVQWILDKALADFPRQGIFHYEKALTAHQSKENALALSHFRRAADLEPQNIIYQKSLGDCLHVTHGQIDAAMEQYRKVLSIDPHNLETLLTIGHLSVTRREFEQAKAYYEKALALDPNQAEVQQMLDQLRTNLQDPATLFEKAQYALEDGDKSGAKQLLEQVVTADPQSAQAHNDLGVLLYEAGDKEGALNHYQKAAQLKPEDPVFLKNLADFLYIERGDIEEALKNYVQALTLNPQDCEALLASGHICLTLGQQEDARIFFNRVLEIEPWNEPAREMLNQLNTMPYPTYGHESDEALYGRAQTEAKEGRRDNAIKTLKMLIAQDPDHAAAYNDLGVLSYESGDKQAALGYYEQAARLEPDNATFLKNLADYYFVEQQRIQEALKIYVRLLEANQQDLDCLMAAGTICASLNRHEDARVFYHRVLEIDPWYNQAREALSCVDSPGGVKQGDFLNLN